MKESSSNEEDETCLKTSYEEETILGFKPSYAHLFRMSDRLVEENEKLRKCTLGIKESSKQL